MGSRIIFLIPSFEHGGAEFLVKQQAEWLSAHGWEVCLAVLSKKYDKTILDTLPLPAQNLLFIHSNHSVLNTASIAYGIRHHNKLVRFIKTRKIEKIIANLPLAHLWGRLVKVKCPSVRLIIYHHSMQYQASPLNSAFKKIFNKAHSILARRTDNLSICISEAVRQNIRDHFTLKNPVVLYNAVSFRKLPAARGKEPGYASSINLVIPGRLHPTKGHLFFLKVYQQLTKEAHQPLQLIIAGGGVLEQEIRAFVHHADLNDSVSVTGFISNDQMLRYMADSDFVIIPSLSEGLGIVGIEALMLGKTVVTSNAGGLKEIFTHGKNGYVFEAGVHEACLNVMRFLLSNSSSAKLPSSGLTEDYKNRFSLEAHMKHFAQLLKTT